VRRTILIPVLAVLLVVVCVGAFVLWPRGSTPITEQEALENFRDESEVQAPPVMRGGRSVPAPGVYRYRATGGESVKLGALPTEDRPYPGEVTGVVVPAGQCFTFTLNLLAQHTEDTTYCTDTGQELTLRDHVKHQQVGALRPEARMTCDPGVLHELTRAELDLRCTLSMSGGPASLDAELVGTSTAEVPASAEVAGEEHEAVKVAVSYEISGDLSGTWDEVVWFGSDWIPLRIERDLELKGLATFAEHSELVLVDRTPEV
jgi:hypothetical protein